MVKVNRNVSRYYITIKADAGCKDRLSVCASRANCKVSDFGLYLPKLADLSGFPASLPLDFACPDLSR